jgi:hypothetical protein
MTARPRDEKLFPPDPTFETFNELFPFSGDLTRISYARTLSLLDTPETAEPGQDDEEEDIAGSLPALTQDEPTAGSSKPSASIDTDLLKKFVAKKQKWTSIKIIPNCVRND